MKIELKKDGVLRSVFITGTGNKNPFSKKKEKFSSETKRKMPATIEWAKNGRGDLFHISKAYRNKIYTCIECEGDLIAVMGDNRQHHFRHKTMDSYGDMEGFFCGGGTGESEQHKMAKALIANNINHVVFVERCFVGDCRSTKMISPTCMSAVIEQDVKCGDKRYRVDVMATDETGKMLAVEVTHKHKTPSHKVDELREYSIEVIEVAAEDVIREFKDAVTTCCEFMIPIIPFDHDEPFKCESCEREMERRNEEMRERRERMRLEEELRAEEQKRERDRKMAESKKRYDEEEERKRRETEAKISDFNRRINEGEIRKCVTCDYGEVDSSKHNYRYCNACYSLICTIVGKFDGEGWGHVVHYPYHMRIFKKTIRKEIFELVPKVSAVASKLDELEKMQSDNRELFEAIKDGTRPIESYEPHEYSYLEYGIPLNIPFKERGIGKEYHCHWDATLKKWLSPKTGIRGLLFEFLEKKDEMVWTDYLKQVEQLWLICKSSLLAPNIKKFYKKGKE